MLSICHSLDALLVTTGKAKVVTKLLVAAAAHIVTQTTLATTSAMKVPNSAVVADLYP